MSIKHKETKIKQLEENTAQDRQVKNSPDHFVLILIIIVSFASFGLGRLSAIEDPEKQPIIFERSLSAATLGTQDILSKTPEIQSGSLVASKNGTKYHFPWCSGAQRIKKENEIWFNTVTDARKAGYTPAANCKGLE